MKRVSPFSLVFASALSWFSEGATFAKITPEQAKTLPPPANHKIDFAREIKPILEASCIKCHGRGRTKGELSIESRDTLLKGGESGPAIVPGKSEESRVIELVAGLDPDSVMPQKGKRLTPDQIGLLRAWIDQGAAWDASISFAKPPPPNLFPRKPELPASRTGVVNPIDRILRPYYEANGLESRKPVSDRIYARRVYLDAIGLLPTPKELNAFLADKRSDKRGQLVKHLLSDNRRYAEGWLTFWNDALRNDYRGTGYIDGGRKQITDWLYAALARNMPFDQFVRELVNPTPESEGFAQGIIWRGVVNASQTPQMQAAQNISQVFMGVNLKCASCHDSFINDWMLSDSYGLAGIYSDEPLEMVHCDKPTGQFGKIKFIYPELGDIDPKAPKAERLKQLADVITSRKDGRLTRTIVNRFWAKFMGRGLVEPVDEMDNAAWNQDLLDWLASDLADNGYNLKHTIELILTSRAYQLPAVPMAEETSKEFVFRGPVVRRLSAEEFLDALSTVTGVWQESSAARIDFSVADPRLGRFVVEPKWIWKEAGAAEKTEALTLYWRKEIDLAVTPDEAVAVVACDNSFKLFVNGKEAGAGNDHTQPKLIDLKSRLVKGKNLIAVEAVNARGKPEDNTADQANPAGLILYARIRQEPRDDDRRSEVVLDLTTDKTWRWSAAKIDGWQKPEFAANDWQPAVELGQSEMAPWHLGNKLGAVISGAALRGQIRAGLVNSDPLMTALGRPNREQVITTRASAATTLQGLEMTNGSTLAELLKRGATELVERWSKPGRELVVELYQRALGRQPTGDELRLAQELVGSPLNKEGVEDLLWAMTMLPEFQLIY
jgi:mono/diheme cytochrome c family protein